MTKEKVKIDNPFVTTGYAGAEYFCDREKETAESHERIVQQDGNRWYMC